MKTIIVGAGAAGGVLAARLTESGKQDVVLLEAGPDYQNPKHVPGDLRNGRHNSYQDHDWGFVHQPSPDTIPFIFPRGRVVGGSSAVNTCIALRGMPYDYDEWADMGLEGWGFEECLPFFKKLETDLDIDNEWHGQSGPIPVRRHPKEELTPWMSAFKRSCLDLGYGECLDHNDPTTTGVGSHAMNKVDGERMSVARCYLTPEVRARENLTIRPRTLARRVVFRGAKAVGVEVQRDGQVEVIFGDRVLLCAGAIQTPGVLLRSGIGPREDVERIGVDVLVEREGVGTRLLDHPGSALIFRPHYGVVRMDAGQIQMVMRYESERGPMNHMQIQPGNFIAGPGGNIPFLVISSAVGKPVGSGRLRYVSAKADERPEIDSNFFRDDFDLDCIVEALELAWLVGTGPLMRDMATLVLPKAGTFTSRAGIREFVRSTNGSGYHPSGTAPMGISSDEMAVCDARGQVFGVEGVYVCDASAMPTVPSSNTHIPTIMMAERFSDWLRI